MPDVTNLDDFNVHPGWPSTYRVRALSLQGPSRWPNPAAATSAATLDEFDFTAAPTPSMRTLVACGADVGAQASTWIEGKPGAFGFK